MAPGAMGTNGRKEAGVGGPAKPFLHDLALRTSSPTPPQSHNNNSSSSNNKWLRNNNNECRGTHIQGIVQLQLHHRSSQSLGCPHIWPCITSIATCPGGRTCLPNNLASVEVWHGAPLMPSCNSSSNSNNNIMPLKRTITS